MIEVLGYTHLKDGQIAVSVDTGEEKRPFALFIGDYEVEAIEADRFSYGGGGHYTETEGFAVVFTMTSAHYVDENGYDIEEFIYDSQDIDQVDYFLTDILDNEGDI